MGEVVAQKFLKEFKTELDKAVKYYTLLVALNNFKLSNRHIQLLAFTAVRGTITPISAREEFVKIFGSSLQSVENLKGYLVQQGLFIKQGEMFKVLPAIDLDFSKEVVIQINLRGKNEGK